jgi:hypothetical protein
MTLKPRIDINIAMLLAGSFFMFVGFGSAYLSGFPFGLIPAVLGILGVASVAVAVAALWHRCNFAIEIQPSGITIPTGNVFRPGEPVHIPRDAIATIGRDESIRGRFVSIALRTGGKVPIQARQYCELKTFLAHCKTHGLPTA